MLRSALALTILFFVGFASAQSYPPPPPPPSHGNGAVRGPLGRCAWQCSAECDQYISVLETQIQQARSNCQPAPQDLSLHQDAYNWAYSSNGMNLNTIGAQEFANKIFGMPNGRMVFEQFKNSYTWAYSSEGMNLNVNDAKTFAWQMVAQPQPERAFECYKQAFTFAYSSSGMNLNTIKARAHAAQICRIQ